MAIHRAGTVARWIVLASGLGAFACQAFLKTDGLPGSASAEDGGVSAEDATSGPDGAPRDALLEDASTVDVPAPVPDAGAADGAFLPDAHITIFTFPSQPSTGPFEYPADGGSEGGSCLLGVLVDPAKTDPGPAIAGNASVAGPVRHFAMTADLKLGPLAGIDDGGTWAWTNIVAVDDTNATSSLTLFLQALNRPGNKPPLLRLVARFPSGKPVPADCILDWENPNGWGRVGAELRWGGDAGGVAVDLGVPGTLRHCDFENATPPSGLNYRFGFVETVNGVGTWTFKLERVGFAAE